MWQTEGQPPLTCTLQRTPLLERAVALLCNAIINSSVTKPKLERRKGPNIAVQGHSHVANIEPATREAQAQLRAAVHAHCKREQWLCFAAHSNQKEPSLPKTV